MAYVKGTNPSGESLNSQDGITDGADTIVALGGNDFIFAGGGDDTIKGGGGADYIDGGSGRDAIDYSDSLESVTIDLVENIGSGGSAQGDSYFSVEDVYGSQHDDVLIGNTNDNLLNGGDGNDVLKGGGGNDKLIGGGGDDIFEVDGLQDTVEGGSGIDTLMVKSEDYGIFVDLGHGVMDPLNPHHHYHPYRSFVTDVENVVGTQYRDKLFGDGADNRLFGNSGNDDLFGRRGKDHLDGGGGADLINGGQGEDTLRGGAGQDTFQYSSQLDSYWIAGKPADAIMDFQKGVDKIDLSALGLAYGDLTMMNNQTIDGANYSYFGYDANDNGMLEIGEFAVAVKIAPGTTLSAGDFLF
jgi:Ca2+-binding RTX toxin-like protein